MTLRVVVLNDQKREIMKIETPADDDDLIPAGLRSPSRAMIYSTLAAIFAQKAVAA